MPNGELFDIFAYICSMGNNGFSDGLLFSFIITCRDLSAGQVKDCIDSILKLSLREEEREIIVIDDGSDKCLLADMMDYADRIVYVRQPKSGLGAARNTGLLVAKGSYIQFMRGGDKLLSASYGHCLDIARYKDPDIIIFNSGNTENGRNDYEGEKPAVGTEYMKHNFMSAAPWGYAFARKLLIGLKFDTDNKAADEEFSTLLFLRAEKVYSTSAVAYFTGDRKIPKTDRRDKKAVAKLLDDEFAVVRRLHDLTLTMPHDERLAMERRCGQLTMNHIINIIRLTRSSRQLAARIKKLEEAELFPLPDRAYSGKYALFNKLSRNVITRRMLKFLGRRNQQARMDY